uniref:Putative secreted protein n=1 Tax=Amblyomma triste TaxID=251400 RepID=A0A023GBH4_AMBTT
MFQYSAVILLSLWTAIAVAAPSCEIFDARDYRRYTCSGFHSPGDFLTHVRREPSAKPTWFELVDSQLPSLPPAAFAGLNVTILELRRVELRRFDPTTIPSDNPFGGLENTLRRLTFSLGTLPSSLSLLSGLRQLEELELVHYGRLRLTRDFNHLPKSLKTLYIADATIESIESGWIRDLVNLESLIFRGTDLAHFSRDLLPMPAPRFTTLDLPTNKLTFFPVGLGDDLPALNYINLFKNLIPMLREQDLAPLRNKVAVVDMMFNPVHCDCNLSFILDYPSTWHFFLCASPRELRDEYISNVHHNQLKCERNA